MLPGDSLVERIFTEGIDHADAFIVVLSANSVHKRWVQEELNAAVVKRIEDQTKLIPVVLDDLQREDVPAAVRHLVWEPITDVNEYDGALDRIIRAVFGHTNKPPLGPPPGYAAISFADAPGLSRIDSIILKAAGDEAVRDFGDLFDTGEFYESLHAAFGLDEGAFLESMEVLDHDGYIELHRTMGRGLPAVSSFKITTFGFHAYAEAYMPDYDDATRDVCLALVDLPDGQGTDDAVADRTKRPRMVVLHVLRMLENSGLLRLAESYGASVFFHGVSPKIRRILEG